MKRQRYSVPVPRGQSGRVEQRRKRPTALCRICSAGGLAGWIRIEGEEGQTVALRLGDERGAKEQKDDG